MNIELNKLEDKFIATALKNGLSYWKKDQFEIIEDSATGIKAIVYGTDEYTSEIVFSGKSVVNVNCSCPNYRTLFCKHIAILYYEKFKDIFELKKSKPRKASVKNKKNVKNIIPEFSLEKEINNLPEKELKEFLLLAVKNNNDFKNFLEDKLNPKNQPKENLYAFYKKEISKVLQGSKTRGFISSSASNKVGKFVIDYAHIARQYFDDMCLVESFAMCKAIIGSMIRPLNYTDTSSGVFYQGLEMAMEILSDIAANNSLQPTLREEIYNTVLKLFRDKKNHGWGYEERFVNILVQLAENNKEKEELLEIINKEKKEDYQLSVYAIIKKFEGEVEAKRFASEHKTVPAFRTILFNDLMSTKNYDAAIECMNEGISVNQNFRGVVIKWIQNLLDVGEITNNKDLIIKCSKTLFLNLGFNTGNQDRDYYGLFKNQFTQKQWLNELPLLIEKIRDKNVLEEVYYIEGNSEMLYKIIFSKNDAFYGGNHLYFNEKYIESLLPAYELEIKQLLQVKIVNFIEIYKGKGYYKEVCQTLIKFKKLGVDVSEIVLYLQENYQRRPSLMTQLNDHFN